MHHHCRVVGTLPQTPSWRGCPGASQAPSRRWCTGASGDTYFAVGIAFRVYGRDSSCTRTALILCGEPACCTYLDLPTRELLKRLVYTMLGPVLFLIYINGIVRSSLHLNLLLYADDATLYIQGKNLMLHIMNEELILICNWLSSNKVNLNVKKTCFINSGPLMTRTLHNILSKSKTFP